MLTHKDIEAVGLDLGFTGKQLDARLCIMQACSTCDDVTFLQSLQKAPDAKAYFARHWEALEEATAWYILANIRGMARSDLYFDSFMAVAQWQHGIHVQGLQRVYRYVARALIEKDSTLLEDVL